MEKRVERILTGAVENERVAGAYLFVGGSPSDKAAAAEEFSAILGCVRQDIFKISPSGAAIKIEQIRELSSLVRYGPSAGKYLLVIIHDADEMTVEAAGAFLKTLEEPMPGVVFVLIAQREEKILETIKSRCQKILFPDEKEDLSPQPESIPYYQELENFNRKSIVEVLNFSSRLSQEKGRVEERLYDFAGHFRQTPRRARLFLDAVRSVKKKANLKLALDDLCLKLCKKN